MDCIDLHAHSTASDGTLAPAEVAQLAKKIGLRAVALTDHDTADGLEEFTAAGTACGIETVPGMETTMVIEGRDVHVVCLYFDRYEPNMSLALEDIASSRRERNEAMLHNLQQAGLPVYAEDLAPYGDRAISRGHFAKILVARGYAKTPKEAIKTYMSVGTPGYVRRRTPDPAQFIATVHGAGGLAFVAHLHLIHPGEEGHCISICNWLLDQGADGLETQYSEYDDHWRQVTEEIAVRRGVLRSGGSDFHGGIKPGLDLGTGYGGLCVPYSYLQAIKARLGR